MKHSTILKTITVMATAISALGANAQGRFETVELPHSTLHIYYSNDVMGDASYIIEGKKGLVTLEAPLFKVGQEEFNSYLTGLDKKVVANITDYHQNGFHEGEAVMAEGFREFITGPIYGGMIQGFKQGFGDSMVELADRSEASEVKFGESIKLAGVKFEFRHGAVTDFPAASIIIDGTAYFTHWTPAKAHVSTHQVSSSAAIDAEIEETRNELASGCRVFIGGHGGACTREAVEFNLSYLNTLKTLLSSCADKDAFVKAVNEAYPELPGDIEALAAALYK